MAGEIHDPDAYLRAAVGKGLERFADCFHGSNRFSDIDGAVLIAGRLLVTEFKNAGQALVGGQRRLLEHLSRMPGVDVYVVWQTPVDGSAGVVVAWVNVARDGFDPVPRDCASLHVEWLRWHDEAIAIQNAASIAAWAAARTR